MMLVLGLGVGHLWGAAGKNNTNSKQSGEETITVKAKGNITVGAIGGGSENESASLSKIKKETEVGFTGKVG